MTSIREAVRRFRQPAQPLPAGTYHYQSPLEDPRNYRLHLRMDDNGSGMLIINAATVLHLNPTAAEYAYYIIQQIPEDQVIRKMMHRYRVAPEDVQADYRELAAKIDILANTADLEPEIMLHFSPVNAASMISHPYRLDCALTYNIPAEADSKRYFSGAPCPELDTFAWQQVLDKAWAAGIVHIIFTGGEPTLRADLPALIQHAEKNGQVTGLVSDGTKLLQPDYLNELLQTGLDHLVLLFDPANNASWQTLERIATADLSFVVHLTIRDDNANQVAQALPQLAQKGVTRISFSVAGENPATAAQVAHITDLAASLQLEQIDDIPTPHPPVPVAFGEPDAARSRLYVQPDGDIYAFQGAPDKLGNLSTTSWENITLPGG